MLETQSQIKENICDEISHLRELINTEYEHRDSIKRHKEILYYSLTETQKTLQQKKLSFQTQEQRLNGDVCASTF